MDHYHSTTASYLSEIYNELPSNCLLNKGITGCGGTYVELNSERNSVILVPTRELVKNKRNSSNFGVDGKVKDKDLEKYITSSIKNKKIIGTYDSLPRILRFINPQEYFLLIDEYHIMFNYYTLRNEAIYFILKNYTQFKGYCFMTATPLKDEMMLTELEDLDKINIEWINAVPVKVDIIDNRNTNANLIKILSNPEPEVNYHIFLNTITSITKIVEKLGLKDYKVVCSDVAKARTKLHVEDTTTPPKKFNFYTATAFEGCDIYDQYGKTIILCDTKIASTILDISTLIRQITGRLRDSIYKDQITLILNTSFHRYAGTAEDEFKLNVELNEKIGTRKIEMISELSNELDLLVEKRSYSPDTYNSFYVNFKDDEFFFDINLKRRDLYNYFLISGIYNSSITVIKEINENKMIVNKFTKSNWATEMLTRNEYTYSELRELYKEELLKRDMKFNKYFIDTFLPPFKRERKMVKSDRQTYYIFNN